MPESDYKNRADPGCSAVNSHDEHMPLSAQSASRLTRRLFLRNVTVTAAAVMTGACGGGGGSSVALAGNNNSADVATQPAASNRAPVWDLIPTISFTEGIAASFSIAAYVTDADNDTLSITKNTAALPAGITYDAATKSFSYDGVGAVAATDGHVLIAMEG